MSKVKLDLIDRNENGERYSIKVYIPMSLGFIENVTFILDNVDIYNMNYLCKKGEFAVFELEKYFPTKAIYHFYFKFCANGAEKIFDESFSLSVNFKTPKWTHGKMMYHIFVDRFSKDKDLKHMKNRFIHKNWNEEIITGPDENGFWNTDFYGGSLKGIINKLSYIQSLGVDILYLSPIFYSQSNHRYDTSDYELIDPYLGDECDLIKLCDECHKRGMHIILDAVFNHTGNDSKYFNEYSNFDILGAYNSKSSEYYDFYRRKNDSFEYWWGMKNLPVCDGNSPHWQDYIYGEGGIIDKWFKCDIDGLRLDVADELTDEFIEGIRGAVKRNKEDGFILGEVWKNPMRMNRGYISSGKGMDSVMNYQLVDALIRYFKYADVYRIKEVLNELKYEYPKETLFSLMNFTSTHDISRAINIFGSDRFKKDGEWAWNLYDEDYEKSRVFKLSNYEYEKGKELFKLYLFTLTFCPGILSIFYGDEIGMEGEGNLYNRKAFTWDKIDYDLLEYFRFIGNVRKEEYYSEAEFNPLEINEKTLSFERISDKYKYETIVNRTDEEIKIDLPQNFDKIYTLNSNRNVLKPHGGITIRKK
ncbi:MAG: glycoside hydrolase family 13 protein [Bacilli bacterium]|nr:glycoside hydrolase family 13 protein [Bacilli bacterium]